MSRLSTKLAFFRQSGWLVLTTVVGGGLMYAVHKAAGKMPKAEYGVFTTMLQVLTQMTIPAIGLQTIVMRQTVAALTAPLQRQLSGAVRRLLLGTGVVWVVAMALTLLCQGQLVESFKISNRLTVWLTASWGLWILWQPIFTGLLQGQQNFLWMGWVTILGGVARLGAVVVIVLWLGGQAAGACLGVLIQMVVVVALAGWETRRVWLGPSEPVAWGDWWRRILPLTLGPGVITYMMSLDMIVVQYFFPEVLTGYYAAAGMIGRAMVFLTAPLTWVMFPKVAESAARSEKSNAALLAVGATALIGGGAALFCTVWPTLPLRIVYDESFLRIAWLVPWFAWGMLPLSLGTVLVNNLLAREQYRVVVWLVLVALAYAGALAAVCQRNASPRLSARAWQDLPALAARLRQGSDPVSGFLQTQLTAQTKRLLVEEGGPGRVAEPLAAALAEDLNQVLENATFYDEKRFAGVQVNRSLRELAAAQPRGAALIRLNRLLLEEAYPAEVVPVHRGFLPVVQTLGCFGLVLVGVSLWFTLRLGPHRPKPSLPFLPPAE